MVIRDDDSDLNSRLIPEVHYEKLWWQRKLRE